MGSGNEGKNSPEPVGFYLLRAMFLPGMPDLFTA